MEYLDPEKKRKHRQRIALGYILIGLLISMVTLIVLLAGYGYGFDRKTGEFVQNGIMFVDTKHRQAQVTLNDELYGQTDLRLVLREGEYQLVATREGYRDWTRTVSIKGGKLRKLTYGLLVPETLQSNSQFSLNELPIRSLQSIDKDRILAWDAKQANTLLLVDIAQDPATLERLSLESVISNASADFESDAEITIKDMKFIDFDSSDQRVLAEITINNKLYTWLIDTQNIELSRNITATLPSAFRNDNVEITMIDRNPSRFYVFDKTAGEVYEAELRGSALSLLTIPDVSNKILSFTSYSSDWLLYVTESDGDEGLVDVYFRQNDSTKLLKQMKTSKLYFLAIANNGGKPFMGIGATNESAVFVYVDPVEYLKKNSSSSIPAPSSIMPLQNLLNITVSNDASVVMAFSGKTVITYDYLSEDTHTKQLDHELSTKEQIKWIDGQHYSYVHDGTAWMIDYDGSNQQQLTATSAVGIFYRDDSEGYFSFTSNDNQVENALAQSFVFTSLVTEADQ